MFDVYLAMKVGGKKHNSDVVRGSNKHLILRKRTIGFYVDKYLPRFLRTSKAIVASILILVFIAVQGFRTDAALAAYYFTSCLGEWQNVDRVTGAPNANPDEVSDWQTGLTEQNSAILENNTGSVFCGKLDLSKYEGGDFKKVYVRIALVANEDVPEVILNPDVISDGVIDQNLASTTQGESGIGEIIEDVDNPDIQTDLNKEAGSDENTDAVKENADNQEGSEGEVLSETVTSESGAEQPTEPAPTQESAPAPAAEPAPAEPVSFWGVKIAHAQEASPASVGEPASSQGLPAESTTSSAEPVPVESNPEITTEEPSNTDTQPESDAEPSEDLNESSVESTDPIIESDTAGESDNASTTDIKEETNATSTSDEIITGIVEDPETEFIELLYTIDGSEWVSFSKFNKDDIKSIGDMQIDLPISDLESLKNIQISLQVYRMLENQPTMLLDSIWIEAEAENQVKDIPEEMVASEHTVFPISAETNDYSEERGDTVDDLVDGVGEVIKNDEEVEIGCKAEPNIAKLSGSEIAEINIKLNRPRVGDPVNVLINTLPAGLKASIELQNFATDARLVIAKNPEGARIGSFNVPIVYSVKTKDGLIEKICQIGLEIE